MWDECLDDVLLYRDVDALIRVISDSNIAISVDEIEALVGSGAGDEDYSQLVEDLPQPDTFMMESFRNRSRPCIPIPLDPVAKNLCKILNFKI